MGEERIYGSEWRCDSSSLLGGFGAMRGRGREAGTGPKGRGSKGKLGQHTSLARDWRP